MEQTGRLPQWVLPNLYTITLKVIPSKDQFVGHETIDIVLSEQTKTIVLHALDLVIEQAEISQNGQSAVATVSEDKPNETILLTFQQVIAAGPAKITIAYSGKFNKQLRGLYEVENDGEKYAFTQFEATDARRMIPCFDEPAMKARFALTVIHPADLTAISNMPIQQERMEGASYKTTRFNTTPIMSTYLLALCVARLKETTIKVGETTVSVWALEKQLPISAFALKVTAAVLPRLNDYFGLPYPYPKLDLIAVPNFAMGAMENWGAIFFRDSCLLLDEGLSSTQSQRDVANVITHEIVHQWFGNLVTMKWWDDLWLNESFATWLACKIVDQWRPEWNSWVEFQQEKEIPLAIDALHHTRPIRSEVKSAAQIEEMFDALTYEKGAACLRMIETFLGEASFQKGIQNYMRQFQYQNAPAEALWNALSAASGQPVLEIARDWFLQPGFPLVTLSNTCNDAQSFTFTQQRFMAVPDGMETKMSARWHIPFTFLYQDAEGLHKDRLLLKDAEVTLKLPQKVSFIYGNADEAGFLRVAYDADLTKQFASVLPDTIISPSEKIGTLGNLWAFSVSGTIPIAQFLDTLFLFKGDQTRVVIEATTAYLETLLNQFVTPEESSLFEKAASSLLNAVWKDLGWGDSNDPDEERNISRAAALWGLGALAQDEEILSELPRRLTRYWAMPNSLNPTLVTSLLRLCARSDGGSLFDPFFQKYQSTEVPEDRDRYLTALTEFNKPVLAMKLLERTLTDSIRSQDVWRPIRNLLRYSKVQKESWEFMKANWAFLHEKAGSVGATRMIQSTRHLWKPQYKDEVAQFFNRPENKVEAAERALAQTLEFIELGIQFKEKQGAGFRAWLKGKSG
ncbi:MAG: M1 family metallopeptidase [Nitrospirota bacterium]